MYKNAIFICISRYKQLLIPGEKNADVRRDISRVLYFFDLL